MKNWNASCKSNSFLNKSHVPEKYCSKLRTTVDLHLGYKERCEDCCSYIQDLIFLCVRLGALAHYFAVTGKWSSFCSSLLQVLSCHRIGREHSVTLNPLLRIGGSCHRRGMKSLQNSFFPPPPIPAGSQLFPCFYLLVANKIMHHANKMKTS